jgi:hypothetical protein
MREKYNYHSVSMGTCERKSAFTLYYLWQYRRQVCGMQREHVKEKALSMQWEHE